MEHGWGFHGGGMVWSAFILFGIVAVIVAIIVVVVVIAILAGKAASRSSGVGCACGAVNAPGSRYCSQCGRPIGAPPGSTPPAPIP